MNSPGTSCGIVTGSEVSVVAPVVSKFSSCWPDELTYAGLVLS